MQNASGATFNRRGRRVREFLDKLYWTLGVFCLLWSGAVVVGVLRRRSLELPVFGKTQLSETFIFTLLGFCVLLPVLLLVIGVFRAASAKHQWGTRFPGVPGDEWEIPASFAWLRVVIYFVLTIFPTATMVFCCARMPTEMQIEESNIHKTLKGAEIFHFPQIDTKEKLDWRWTEVGTEVLEHEPAARVSAFPPWEPWIFVFFCSGCAVTALCFLFLPIRE